MRYALWSSGDHGWCLGFMHFWLAWTRIVVRSVSIWSRILCWSGVSWAWVVRVWILSCIPASQHAWITSLQNLWTILVLLLWTPHCGGDRVLDVGWQNNLSVLKSSPRVWWSPHRPRGLPNGRYHVASRASANSGVPVHKSIGLSRNYTLGVWFGLDVWCCEGLGDWSPKIYDWYQNFLVFVGFVSINTY